MKEERLKILKMIEDGKISADEGAKLLEVLNKQYAGDYDYAYDWEQRMGRFNQNMTDFAKDVSDRMNAAYKDVEPRLRDATKTVVSKTAEVTANISKSLYESLNNIETGGCDCGCGCDEQPKSDDEPKEN